MVLELYHPLIDALSLVSSGFVQSYSTLYCFFLLSTSVSLFQQQFPSLHSGCCSIIFSVVDDEENPNFSNKTSSVIPFSL